MTRTVIIKGRVASRSRDSKAIRIRSRRRRPSLGELLRGVQRKNVHREVSTGAAIGREVW